MRTYISVDVEANGPIPGVYSMTSLGAVLVDESLGTRFSANLQPISDASDPARDRFVDSANARPAGEVMQSFADWLDSLGAEKLVFVSDNNGFDWMFVCYYLWRFCGRNPFGYYSENMQSLLRGASGNLSEKISDFREGDLSHQAVDDAVQNARVFKRLRDEYGLE